MPDRDLPPRARLLLRWLRAVMYAAVAGSGAAAMVWAPGIVPGVPRWATLVWATLALAGGAVSCIGVAVARYRIEWAAVWPTAGGVGACAALCWISVALGTTRLLALALAMTALVATLALRGEELRIRAALLRRQEVR